MSRSRRKTPVTGITTAVSEKQDKLAYNRRYRRACKETLTRGVGIEMLPVRREHSNPWNMSKDGKTRFDQKKYPELMRK